MGDTMVDGVFECGVIRVEIMLLIVLRVIELNEGMDR